MAAEESQPETREPEVGNGKGEGAVPLQEEDENQAAGEEEDVQEAIDAVDKLLDQMGWRQPDQTKPSTNSTNPLGEEDDQVAGMSAENRPFMEVLLGGVTYRALFDSGAMISLAGPSVAKRYANRL